MKKIDSHVHFWQLARGDYSWLGDDMRAIQRDFLASDFDELRMDNEIEGIVLVQAAPTLAETRFLLELAGHCDFVAAFVGKVEIEKGEIALQQLDELGEHALFRGIRPMLKNMQENRWLELPALDVCIRRIVELDLTFECMVMPSEMDELALWLQRYPDLRAVLCHGGMPDIAAGGFDYWASRISKIAENSSLYCKLSGLTTLAGAGWNAETLRPYLEHLVSCFGHERLIWGSDWPVLLCAGTYAEWNTTCATLLSALTEDEQKAIYIDNAQHFYRV